MTPRRLQSVVARTAVITTMIAAGCARPPAASLPAPGLPAPGLPTAARATLRFAPGDSVAVDTVAPDVVHYRVRRAAGPYNIQIVAVPVRARYEIIAARAHDSLRSRERVTDMVRRHTARGERIVAALNADFFDLKTGANENNQVVGGKIWKAVPVTDSPFDTFRSAHTQFAVGANGRPYLDRFTYAGTLTSGCGRFALDGVNSIPRISDALILFTGAYADAPRQDSLHVPRELVMRASPAGTHAIGELVLTGGAAVDVSSGQPIPGSVGILAAYGSTGTRLDSIARCSSPLRLTHAFRPDRGHLTTIAGGWPRVVRDGRSVAAAADSVEGTFPRFSAQRHPRSAVGFSRDSSFVYLVAVDGRQETSDGMSLVELADFLVSIGVYQALNFDGGGSTSLVIDGRRTNRPSDTTGERAVGNAILVRERRP